MELTELHYKVNFFLINEHCKINNIFYEILHPSFHTYLLGNNTTQRFYFSQNLSTIKKNMNTLGKRNMKRIEMCSRQ